jgi:hypothetical protein
MNDPWNPLPDEIREWAYTDGALEPCQDWDLALSRGGYEKPPLECAADARCPNRAYFLSVLYLVVGDALRTDFRAMARPIVEAFIQRGDEYRHPDIRLWQQRSRHLMKHPEKFDYRLWCAGGLARTPAAESFRLD